MRGYITWGHGIHFESACVFNMWAHGGVPLILLKGRLWETLRGSGVQDMTWQRNILSVEVPIRVSMSWEAHPNMATLVDVPLGEEENYPDLTYARRILNLWICCIWQLTVWQTLYHHQARPLIWKQAHWICYMYLFCFLIEVLVTHKKKKKAYSRPGKWATKSIANNLYVSIKLANVGLALDQSNPALASLVWFRVKFGRCFSMVALLTTSDFYFLFSVSYFSKLNKNHKYAWITS